LTYKAPSIITISGCDFGSAGCAAAGQTITIIGQDFGASGAQVWVGNDACLAPVASLSAPHRVLTCTLPPGTGQNVPVRMFNGRFSAPFYISYE
jgi:hypothetical protein